MSDDSENAKYIGGVRFIDYNVGFVSYYVENGPLGYVNDLNNESGKYSRWEDQRGF